MLYIVGSIPNTSSIVFCTLDFISSNASVYPNTEYLPTIANSVDGECIPNAPLMPFNILLAKSFTFDINQLFAFCIPCHIPVTIFLPILTTPLTNELIELITFLTPFLKLLNAVIHSLILVLTQFTAVIKAFLIVFPNPIQKFLNPSHLFHNTTNIAIKATIAITTNPIGFKLIVIFNVFIARLTFFIASATSTIFKNNDNIGPIEATTPAIINIVFCCSLLRLPNQSNTLVKLITNFCKTGNRLSVKEPVISLKLSFNVDILPSVVLEPFSIPL